MARLPDDRGYVLIWALFAFVVLGGLATISLKTSGSERRLAKAAAGWNQSFYAAEAGLEAALQVTSDSVLEALTPGDSLDLGWRSLGGQIDYHAVFRRIDNGGLDLFLLRSTGRNGGLFGGQTTVNLAFTTAAEPTGGLLLNSNLTISGDVSVGGECGIHVNDWLYVPGTLTTNGPVTATGSVEGNIETSASDAPMDSDFAADYGLPAESATETAQGSVSAFTNRQNVPPVTPNEFCAAADFKVENGWIAAAEGSEAEFGTGVASNWELRSAGEYRLTGPPEPGTYCVDGSVDIHGSNIGSAGAPLNVSILATGFVEVSGSSASLQADHSEDILFAAEGDVVLSSANSSFGGAIWAGAQCEISGSDVSLDGVLICRGDMEPPGVRSLTNENVISNDFILLAECGVGSGGANAVAKPLTQRAWWRGY